MPSKKELLNFRIKPKQNEKLEEIANSKDITKSELIRLIIDNYLNLV